jgi:hypothetical protein
VRQKDGRTASGHLSFLDITLPKILVSSVERVRFKESNSDICLFLLQRSAFCWRAVMPYQ